jgi:hypothetical protein
VITYCFRCSECGARVEAIGQEAAENVPEVHLQDDCAGTMVRDWKAEAANVNVDNLR